ncbi:MAG: hypothetical protein B6241_00500 [Spirochaetaceae bacterium 4572_59]|nr:MAG: hypothetical protein B6241_00500 [Spirochaetaceae bacterium 4572_59]
MGKNQLERILGIDRIIRDRGGCTKEELLVLFEVSGKSVERDFAYMRDRLHAPLDYNRHNELYTYSDSSYFLPSVSLSEGEVMALALSSEILNHFNYVDDFNELRDSLGRMTSYLLAFRGSWYIVARDPSRGNIRTYALGRMQKPYKTNTTFTIPADFRLEDYVDPEWGIYSRREKYDFVLTFTPRVADLIREKIWHRDQKLEELADGSVVLSFSSGQIETIGQWVLGWGADVHVASPVDLIERIKETASRLGNMYG